MNKLPKSDFRKKLEDEPVRKPHSMRKLVERRDLDRERRNFLRAVVGGAAVLFATVALAHKEKNNTEPVQVGNLSAEQIEHYKVRPGDSPASISERFTDPKHSPLKLQATIDAETGGVTLQPNQDVVIPEELDYTHPQQPER